MFSHCREMPNSLGLLTAAWDWKQKGIKSLWSVIIPPHGCRDDLLGVCVLHSHFLIWLAKHFGCQFEGIFPGNADKIIKFHIKSMSFPVHQELPSPRSLPVVSMLHYEVVLWNSLCCYIKVHNEKRWKRKKEGGETDDQAERKDGIKRTKKTKPMLYLSQLDGCTLSNFAHLCYNASPQGDPLGLLLLSIVWHRLIASFIHSEQGSSCRRRSNRLWTHLESMTSPGILKQIQEDQLRWQHLSST